jgi:hypothetical protein
MAENEIIELKTKQINGVELTDLDISKVAMICDYLVLDRFNDISSFIRFEKCFGPLFSKEPTDFLVDAYQEICGPKKKYVTFGRLILAYSKWKSNSSQNGNFNKFMDIVFNKMIKTQDEVIGKLVEGGRVFSTRNTRGRKIISKFSVITDDSKNNIQGFLLQYDDFFDSNLSTKKAKEEKNITLEMNFPPSSEHMLDRDGVSHIAGKYSVTTGVIKFLIFKCRSGKTFYIGDNTENDGEQIELFILGTSSCQIKSLRIETVKEQLIYLEAKFQPSLRVNLKIVPFDDINEKYINENIINAPLIYEENEIQSIPMEKLDKEYILTPAISDDTFIEKGSLEEKISGKFFHEVYKTYFLREDKEVQLTEEERKKLEEEREEIKRKIYEKTVQRKMLLRISFKKFKIKDNIFALKGEKEEKEERINMDRHLAKIKRFKRRVNKLKDKVYQELEKEKEAKKGEKDDEYEEEEDWPEDKEREKENEVEEIKVNDKEKENEDKDIIIEKEKNEDEPKIDEQINKKDNDEKENVKDKGNENENEINIVEVKDNENEQEKEENIINENENKKEEEPKKEEEQKKEEKEEKEEIIEIKNDEPKNEEKIEIKNNEEPKQEDNNEIKINSNDNDKKENDEIIIEGEKINIKIEDDKNDEIKLEDNQEEKKIRLRGKKPHKLINKKLNKENKEILATEEDKKEEDKKEEIKEIIIKESEDDNAIKTEKDQEKENVNIIKEKDNDLDNYEKNDLKKDDNQKDNIKEIKENVQQTQPGRKTGACSRCIII